jgi:MFS family permease
LTENQEYDPDNAGNNETTQKNGIKSLISNSNFSAMFTGGLISEIGSYFTFIAMMFLALDLTSDLSVTASTQAIAWIMVFFVIPSATIGPFTGVFVDRYDRKMIMWMSDLVGAASSLGLVYVTLVSRTIEHIYVLAFLSAVVRLFFYPARGASIPKVVEDPQLLVQANGLIQVFSQSSRMIGPALAGIIVAGFGLETAFILDAVSYLISALLILTIRTDLKPKAVNGSMSVKTALSDLKTGFVLVKDDRILRFIMIYFIGVILFIGMVDPLFAAYISHEFGLSEKQFGFILSVSSVSGFLAAILLTVKGQISRKITFMVSSALIGGFSLFVLGIAPLLPQPILWLYVGMALVGMINVVIAIPLSALMQTIVENEHLGKVNGFIGTGISLAMTGGAVLASYLVGFVSTSLIYSGVGIGCFSLAIIGMILVYSLRLEDEAQSREQIAIQKAREKEAIQDTLYPEVEHEKNVIGVSAD